MKYDFETIIDRDPAIRGTGKYRIMKDSKGNKPPKGIVPLSVADMEFRTAPCVIDAIKAEADFGVLGYHRLTDSFRESCCQWMKTRHDWDVQPDWIVPFEQVVPALYNAVWTFTQPGDGILIQTPDYHHFTGATVNTGRKVLENRLVADEKGHYTVDFDDFREKAKQAKLFFLCSPQNPTGRVWTEEELRRMGEICNEYGVMVVADEIHHDLIQPGYKHIVYASLGKEFADNCVICTSLSKTFNLAGLCYASIIIPNDEVRAKFQKQMGLQAFMHIERFGPVAHEAAYGPSNGGGDEFTLRLHGVGCHGARPHTGKDPILLAAKVIEGFQQIISRELDPLKAAVISVCSVQAGQHESKNVVPHEAVLAGTVRTLEEDVRTYVLTRMEEIVAGLCSASRCSYTLEHVTKVPPLTSDQQLTQLVENTAVELVGRENVLYRPAPTMGVEDFSWYTRNYNACMFYFGARNVEKGIITRGHNPKFDIDEECFRVAMPMFILLSKRLMLD